MRASLKTALPIALFLAAALVLGGTLLLQGGGAPAVDDDKLITVYSTPTCGCCGDWEDHLRARGFEVDSRQVQHQSLNRIKLDSGIPFGLASCHTAFIGPYAVEGHVPASDIRRLMAERPEAVGLVVPGMPIGSPGMEIEGRPAQAYDVLLLDAAGETSVFSHHPGDA